VVPQKKHLILGAFFMCNICFISIYFLKSTKYLIEGDNAFYLQFGYHVGQRRIEGGLPLLPNPSAFSL